MPSRKRSEVSRWEIRFRSAGHAQRIGTALGHALHAGDVVALYGDLGTGKTTLVRGIATGLGIPAGRVSSPTFVLIRTYMGRVPLVHADFYRLDDPRQLREVALSDYCDGRRVVAVEWAEKAASELPQDRLDVCLAHHSPSMRDAVFIATGPKAVRLLTRAVEAYSAASASPTRRRVRRKR